jgi:DNA-binding NarL/FixJ family response regulator
VATTVDLSLLPSVYRRGLTGVLEAASLDLGDDPSGLVLVPLVTADDCAAIDRLTAGDRRVVALVRPLDGTTAAHALRHGAIGVADWDGDADGIVDAVLGAVAGRVTLPIAVAAALPGAPLPHGPVQPLGAEERRWLLALARGVTVVRLADDEAYSERGMFRRLHDLYLRLGATNRSEAILAAQRLGLLDD